MSRLPIDFSDLYWFKKAQAAAAAAAAAAVALSSAGDDDDDDNDSDDDSSDYSDFSDDDEETEYCVVDFNFYRGNDDGELVVKELAVCIQSLAREQSWVFMPPYPKTALKPDIALTVDNHK